MDAAQIAQWTEKDVEERTVSLLGKQGPFRPTVRLLEADGRKLVAKDYRACWAPYRWIAGAWNLAREKKALGRLRGLEGIPQIEGFVGRWILLLTYFEGRDLGKVRRAIQTPEFFDELLALVKEMHARGVVHLDLRQRRNVLLGKGRKPVILDFGTALCLRPGTWLHHRLARIDRSGVVKYKVRANPDKLTEREQRLLDRNDRRRKFWPF
jgi:RIO-like serine/threonine protein kinase